MMAWPVAFLDACYSGTVKGAPPDPSKAVADLAAEENGVIVFASSGPKQLSEEYAPEHHGAFTAALLDGFAGAADYDHDRVRRFTELCRSVPGCCPSRGCAATPASRWTRPPPPASSRWPRSPRSASAPRRCSSSAEPR